MKKCSFKGLVQSNLKKSELAASCTPVHHKKHHRGFSVHEDWTLEQRKKGSPGPLSPDLLVLCHWRTGSTQHASLLPSHYDLGLLLSVSFSKLRSSDNLKRPNDQVSLSEDFSTRTLPTVKIQTQIMNPDFHLIFEIFQICWRRHSRPIISLRARLRHRFFAMTFFFLALSDIISLQLNSLCVFAELF